jgi:hypothetical protein
MNSLRFSAYALLVVAATFLTPAVRHVSAMPLQPLAYATNSDVATINCKPGTPNCTLAKNNAPSFCGGPGNPCVMDGAPDCQNASSCGTDNTGHNNLNGAGNMPGVVGAKKNPTTGGGGTGSPSGVAAVTKNSTMGAGPTPLKPVVGAGTTKSH